MVWGKPSSHTYLCAACWSGGVQFELMVPLTGCSIYDEYIEAHGGEGLQHCKIYYDDVKAAVTGYAKADTSHPKAAVLARTFSITSILRRKRVV